MSLAKQAYRIAVLKDGIAYGLDGTALPLKKDQPVDYEKGLLLASNKRALEYIDFDDAPPQSLLTYVFTEDDVKKKPNGDGELTVKRATLTKIEELKPSAELAESLLPYWTRPSLAERMTFDQLLRCSEPKRILRADTVRGPALDTTAGADSQYWFFNFKSFPSTTGLRHRGYIRFFKPAGMVDPKEYRALEKIPCMVECQCQDYRYRWSWTNKQRGSSRVGPDSLSQCWNKAPRKTNPEGRPGLCVAEGELVVLKRGLVPVEQVEVGDIAWTLLGWQKVLDSGFTGIKATVTVSTVDGRSMRITPEHLVLATTVENTAPLWTEAQRLTDQHAVCVTTPDLPEAYATVRLLSSVKSAAVRVYDLTVENAEHFTLGGLVVHNCKHLIALRNYVYGAAYEMGGEEESGSWRLDQLTKASAKRWVNVGTEMAKAREREKLYQKQVQDLKRDPERAPAVPVTLPDVDDDKEPVPEPVQFDDPDLEQKVNEPVPPQAPGKPESFLDKLRNSVVGGASKVGGAFKKAGGALKNLYNRVTGKPSKPNMNPNNESRSYRNQTAMTLIESISVIKHLIKEEEGYPESAPELADEPSAYELPPPDMGGEDDLGPDAEAESGLEVLKEIRDMMGELVGKGEEDEFAGEDDLGPMGDEPEPEDGHEEPAAPPDSRF